MKIRAALLVSLMMIVAAPASAILTWTQTATVGSGNPLNALVVGDVVTIDVTLRSDGELTLGVGGAASGYDDSVVTFTSGTVVGAILTATCIPNLGCLGGLTNLAGNVTLAQDDSNPAGPFVQIATAVDTNGVMNTGAVDEGVDTVAGSAQFQVVFTAAAAGTTTIDLGADPVFGNALILQGGGQGTSNNTSVTVTVPEPAAIASSLAALGSVFAIAGIRRRQS